MVGTPLIGRLVLKSAVHQVGVVGPGVGLVLRDFVRRVACAGYGERQLGEKQFAVKSAGVVQILPDFQRNERY